ncbi:hypothetical protein FQR65_LT20830 [Abscondita terminalis]|nr:hypothetical protein FQR65_LT20830 [Abscondita terminalis]
MHALPGRQQVDVLGGAHPARPAWLRRTAGPATDPTKHAQVSTHSHATGQRQQIHGGPANEAGHEHAARKCCHALFWSLGQRTRSSLPALVRLRSSTHIASRNSASSVPKRSSMRNALGCRTMARPSANRCRSPRPGRLCADQADFSTAQDGGPPLIRRSISVRFTPSLAQRKFAVCTHAHVRVEGKELKDPSQCHALAGRFDDLHRGERLQTACAGCLICISATISSAQLDGHGEQHDRRAGTKAKGVGKQRQRPRLHQASPGPAPSRLCLKRSQWAAHAARMAWGFEPDVQCCARAEGSRRAAMLAQAKCPARASRCMARMNGPEVCALRWSAQRKCVLVPREDEAEDGGGLAMPCSPGGSPTLKKACQPGVAVHDGRPSSYSRRNLVHEASEQPDRQRAGSHGIEQHQPQVRIGPGRAPRRHQVESECSRDWRHHPWSTGMKTAKSSFAGTRSGKRIGRERASHQRDSKVEPKR